MCYNITVGERHCCVEIRPAAAETAQISAEEELQTPSHKVIIYHTSRFYTHTHTHTHKHTHSLPLYRAAVCLLVLLTALTSLHLPHLTSTDTATRQTTKSANPHTTQHKDRHISNSLSCSTHTGSAGECCRYRRTSDHRHRPAGTAGRRQTDWHSLSLNSTLRTFSPLLRTMSVDSIAFVVATQLMVRYILHHGSYRLCRSHCIAWSI